MSRTQLERALSEAELVQMAALLLAAREWDAVLARAVAALQGRRLDDASVAAWARLGVASAVQRERLPVALSCLRRWEWSQDQQPGARELQLFWRAVLAETDGAVAVADDAWATLGRVRPELPGDPWQVVHRAAGAAHLSTLARELAQRHTGTTSAQLARLLLTWRTAHLPPADLVQRWPPGELGQLRDELVTAGDTDAQWWLGLAEALVRRSADGAVLGAAAGLAATTDLRTAVAWTQEALRAGTTADSALLQRAQSPHVPPLERVVAAACALALPGEGAMAALVTSLPLVADEDAVELLAALDQAAPESLPVVVLTFCSDAGRRATMQRALRSLGADEQAEALQDLSF
jgi:hypothetical protein